MAFYDVDNAMTVKLDYELPKVPAFREGIRRAPRREAIASGRRGSCTASPLTNTRAAASRPRPSR